MRHPKKIARDVETDDAYREWLRTELKNHVPELAEYEDWPIYWQWWRGELYLAGFARKESALKFGRQHGWIA